jgi:phosphinothricin acetyltransferase
VTARIRAGLPEDLPAVVDLYNFYVANSPSTFEIVPVTPEARADWLADHSAPGPHRLLVAEAEDGAIVGWATTSPFRPRAAYSTTVESSVYCRADVVGRGIGSRLYRELFLSIADQDVERVVAGIVVPNPPSLALHQRFGFRHVGTFTRVGRKFGRFWDVAWFERPLHLGDSAGPPVRTERSAPGGPGSDPGPRDGASAR